MYFVVLAGWAIVLIAAVFYARWAKHPSTKLIAAYLIFVTTFTVVAFIIFMCLIMLLTSLGQSRALTHPLAAAVFLLAVFVPAFLVARWQLRKPARKQRVL